MGEKLREGGRRGRGYEGKGEELRERAHGRELPKFGFKKEGEGEV